MNDNIYITGKIIKGETLLDVVRQYKSFEDPGSIQVIIHSEGGNVEEGEAVYNYLNGLKAEIPVNTYTDKAYSIAAKIFAVGQERIVEDTDEALMIHFAWAKPKAGNAEYFEAVAEELRKLEDDFAVYYSEFLEVDEDTVRNLLDNETFISGSDAVELGFATGSKVTAEAVAEHDIDNSKNNTMTDKKKNKGQKLLEAMAEFVGIDLNQKPVEINAELTLQDSSGSDIVFPDLESGDNPKVDDAATMDGAAIPDGSYIMPSLEDSTLVFVDGKVSEIIPKEEEEETEAEKEARLAKEAAAEAAAEEIKEVCTWSVNSTNTSFEIGETVMFEGWDGGDPYAASSGEFRLSDGSKIVTDASGVIVSKEPAESAEPALEAEASFEGLLEKVTIKVSEKVRTEIQAEFDAKLAEKDTEIEGLKKLAGKEITAGLRDLPEAGKKKGNRAAAILDAAKEMNN